MRVFEKQKGFGDSNPPQDKKDKGVLKGPKGSDDKAVKGLRLKKSQKDKKMCGKRSQRALKY